MPKTYIYDLPDFVLSIEKASKIFIPGKAPRIEQLKQCYSESLGVQIHCHSSRVNSVEFYCDCKKKYKLKFNKGEAGAEVKCEVSSNEERPCSCSPLKKVKERMNLE